MAKESLVKETVWPNKTIVCNLHNVQKQVFPQHGLYHIQTDLQQNNIKLNNVTICQIYEKKNPKKTELNMSYHTGIKDDCHLVQNLDLQ